MIDDKTTHVSHDSASYEKSVPTYFVLAGVEMGNERVEDAIFMLMI